MILLILAAVLLLVHVLIIVLLIELTLALLQLLLLKLLGIVALAPALVIRASSSELHCRIPAIVLISFGCIITFVAFELAFVSIRVSFITPGIEDMIFRSGNLSTDMP